MKILPKQLSSESTKTSSFFPVFPPRFFYSSRTWDSMKRQQLTTVVVTPRRGVKVSVFCSLGKISKVLPPSPTTTVFYCSETKDYRAPCWKLPGSNFYHFPTFFLCKQRAAAFFTLLRAAALTAENGSSDFLHVTDCFLIWRFFMTANYKGPSSV